jgi:3-dehydrosphinganine reductase
VCALADTLRMEALCYSAPTSKYTVQCAFSANIMTDTFLGERKNKLELTKRMEGTEY